MDDNIQTIIILIILLFCSAFFSAAETAFSALSRPRLKAMIDDGRRLAAGALQLSERYDELLSTILVGNNVVNLTASAIAAVWFSSRNIHHGALISTIVVTLCILIFGEFTPKGMAKEQPEEIAMLSAPILRILMFFCKPINWFFLTLKNLLSRCVKKKEAAAVTDDELIHIFEEATQDGGITEDAGELLKSAIEFRDMETGDICTPRVKMTAVEEKATIEEINQAFRETGFSRLPVYKETLDHIVGVLLLKDFHFESRKTDFNLKHILKPTLFVPATQHINEVLHQMQKGKIHLCIVVDEYGGTKGMLTMEDILEEIVGEIYDEQDVVPEEVREISRNRYLVNCEMELEDFCEQFGIQTECDCQSVGGWLGELFGHLPAAGESMVFENLTMKILKADKTRVLEMQVLVAPKEESSEISEQ